MARGLSFDAYMTAWARKTDARASAIFRESVQRLIESMQLPVAAGGNMPVVTGFLRASLRVTIGSANLQQIAQTGVTQIAWDEAVVVVTIANARIGDLISVRYLANYAWRIEEGFVGTDAAGREYNQSGRHFVALAAQRWPRIVREVTQEAKRLVP